ncbi:TetR/AcrR family transcriptional regulator [Novosphingobium sp. JCM 18896]|uniref:TetR/AcrR family transcriptional regulator n=1 Tax=Novosphingobium sp. JCM 18896 TaxID=2989731 RepID=UPI0022226D1B|nr:TetR/AcrR family transcriptional regulator [Novosphingobium sp. JCM 18896]MCW1432295.1 TetR/AcrR family transcriptional regulator [Novosphingobium sp. JCM 18896]
MDKASNIARRRTLALADGGAEYSAKRTEIIAIAARIFKDKGFKAARLADIASAAGLDRATMYYYVGSKEELFREAVETVLDTNLAYAEALVADITVRPVDKISRFAERLMQSYSANYPYPYVYIQEQMHQVATGTTPWAQDIVQKMRSLEAIVMQMLRNGVSSGELRSDLPVRLVANAFFGMFNWTHRWYEPGYSLDADTIARGFMSIFLDGMATALPNVVK